MSDGGMVDIEQLLAEVVGEKQNPDGSAKKASTRLYAEAPGILAWVRGSKLLAARQAQEKQALVTRVAELEKQLAQRQRRMVGELSLEATEALLQTPPAARRGSKENPALDRLYGMLLCLEQTTKPLVASGQLPAGEAVNLFEEWIFGLTHGPGGLSSDSQKRLLAYIREVLL